MNAMIGAGILTLPAALGAYIGPAGIITTLFVAIAVWFLALSIRQISEWEAHHNFSHSFH